MKRVFFDSLGLRVWVITALCLGIGVLLVGGMFAFAMFASRSGCEQRALSRPDIPVEWHWSTGCILLRPDTTVVVSS